MPYRYVLCCVHADYHSSVLSGADGERVAYAYVFDL